MLKLKDYRWSVAIEAIVGKGLSAFVVDNTYDRQTLLRIMSRVLGNQRGPDVLTSRYTGQPYNPRQLETAHPTVLAMMEVGDLEVRNLLIDQFHVDSILLTDTRLEAERVIEVERPRGASMAYTIEGDQILPGRFYANKKRPLGIIKESVDRAIEEEQRRLRDLESQMYNLEISVKELDKEGGMNRERQGNVRRKLQSVQSKMHKVEMSLKELKSAEEEEESQEDIATYESEVQECQAKIDEMMGQKREQDGQLGELKAKLDVCAHGLAGVEAETEQVTSRMEEMKARHAEYEHERQKADSVLQHYRDRVAEIEGVISSVQSRLSEERKRAEKAAEEASKVC
jgi:chromosome segregation ATPase